MLDSSQEIYTPCDSQETGFHMYAHIFSVDVKMLEILTDLNWK